MDSPFSSPDGGVASPVAEQFFAVANAAQDAIIAADARGNITFWNRAAHAMFGYTADEVMGQPLSIIMPERFRAAHAAGMQRYMATSEAHVIGKTVELFAIRRDGTEFPVELSLGVWRTGENMAFTGIIRDITERQAAQEALRTARDVAERANRSKSDFLARMSHELRTPLNSVIGFANVMLKNRDERLNVGDLTYLQRIQANGRHLLSLINQILDLSKIEAGRLEVELAPVDVGELAASALAQFESLAHDRGITLELQLPATIAPLISDEPKLRQVLFNLIGNAIKFTERGSVTLHVETDPTTHVVQTIRVQDTGIGIPADRIGAIFEPFEQADNTTSRRFGGTGLGLAISRSLSETIGYTLTATSEVGRGTTFTISVPANLPASVSANASTPDANAPTASMTTANTRESTTTENATKNAAATIALHVAPKRSAEDTQLVNDPLSVVAPPVKPIVLVIDDDSDSRLLLMHCVEELGCEVVTAHSGEEGIRLATIVQPSLITLDLMMPGMDGWETLQRLKQDPTVQNIPVVVISMAPSEERGLVIGAADCLDKAASHDAVLTTLRTRLSAR